MSFTAVVTGHLGKDAEVKVTNGKKVINFTVAHTKYSKSQSGERLSKTLWVSCAYWTESDALAPYLKKGVLVCIVGEPDIRTWTGQDGKFGAGMTLTVSKIDLLSKAETTSTPANFYAAQTTSPAGIESTNSPMPSYGDASLNKVNQNQDPLDDLPF